MMVCEHGQFIETHGAVALVSQALKCRDCFVQALVATASRGRRHGAGPAGEQPEFPARAAGLGMEDDAIVANVSLYLDHSRIFLPTFRCHDRGVWMMASTFSESR